MGFLVEVAFKAGADATRYKRATREINQNGAHHEACVEESEAQVTENAGDHGSLWSYVHVKASFNGQEHDHEHKGENLDENEGLISHGTLKSGCGREQVGLKQIPNGIGCENSHVSGNDNLYRFVSSYNKAVRDNDPEENENEEIPRKSDVIHGAGEKTEVSLTKSDAITKLILLQMATSQNL